MTNWNPDAPATIGAQLYVREAARNGASGEAPESVAALTVPAGRGVMSTFRATAAASTRVRHVPAGVSSGDVFVTEVYDGPPIKPPPSSFGSGGLVEEIVDAAYHVSGYINNVDTNPPPSSINERHDMVDSNRWSFSQAEEFGPSTAAVEFTSSQINFPGNARIADVELLMWLGTSNLESTRTFTFDLLHVASGVTARIGSVGVRTTGMVARSFRLGEYNPIARRPWKKSDGARFGGTYRVLVSASRGGRNINTMTTPYLYQLSIRYHTVEETRVWYFAHGPNVGQTPTTVGDGDAPFAAEAGHTYYVVTRGYTRVVPSSANPNDRAAAPSLRYLTDGDPSRTWWTDQLPVVDVPIIPASHAEPWGLRRGGTIDTGPATPTTGAPAGAVLALAVADGETTTDGQPYSAVRHSPLDFTPRQVITPPVSAAYTYVALVVAGQNGVTPTTNLTVQVRLDSNSSLLGTATVTPAAFAAGDRIGTHWRRVVVPFAAPVNVTAATPIRVDLTGVGWEGQVLAAPSTPEDARRTFQGATDGFYEHGVGIPETGWDFALTLHTTPAGPTGATAVSSPIPLAGGPACAATCAPAVTVTWSPSAMGADFVNYELQRYDTRDAEWQTVAIIRDEAETTWTDREARYGAGVETTYRVRSWRVDSIASDWSTTAPLALASCGVGYTFTANATGSALVYADVYDRDPVRDYDLPSQLVVQEMYGRDGVVGFRPTERRFVEFGRTLLVASMATPAGGVGPLAVEALRDLIDDPAAPYVCVRDEDGNRFLALVELGTVETRRVGGEPIITVTVGVIEATRTPAPVEVAA